MSRPTAEPEERGPSNEALIALLALLTVVAMVLARITHALSQTVGISPWLSATSALSCRGELTTEARRSRRGFPRASVPPW